MSQAYSDPEREDNPHALPDLEIFQLTAREVAEQDENMVHEYMKDYRFRLAAMNSKIREAMFEEMIEDNDITGGWYYWYCFPGCMPDSEAIGPFPSYKAALADARSYSQE